MRKVSAFSLFSFLTIASAQLAMSSVVTMQFTGPVGNYYDGVAAYPYGLVVNGVSINGMCDSYAEHITYGETWQVTDSVGLSGLSTVPYLHYNSLGASATTDYELALTVFYGAATNQLNPADANAFIWNLMEPNSIAEPADAASILNWATQEQKDGFNYNLVSVLTPTSNQAGWTDGTPQEFLVLSPSPEPGFYGLMAIGLSGMAVFFRRRSKIK